MAQILRLKEDLIRDEGLRLKPYYCSEGKLTIGVGRNLEAKGISNSIAHLMLEEDIQELLVNSHIQGIIEHLNNERSEVIINMAFNLGVAGLLKFENMLEAVKAQDFDRAAVEMLDSTWAKQVKGRAVRLARQMKTGKHYKEEA